MWKSIFYIKPTIIFNRALEKNRTKIGQIPDKKGTKLGTFFYLENKYACLRNFIPGRQRLSLINGVLGCIE
jgi:hypothetical protein